jgi:hypothetical protein
MGTRGLFVLIALLAWVPCAAAQTLSEAEARSELAWQALPGMPVNPTKPAQPDKPVDDSRPEQARTYGTKSPWAAVGLSLILPGAGHMYADAGGRAKIFLGAEAAIWSLVIIFDRRDVWKSEDAVSYAVDHAQLTPEGKDDDFLERLEFYQNRDEYNTAGRIIDPSRPYLPETSDTYWQWDSEANREAYRDMRNSADVAERNRTFALCAALLNRLVASVDAYRIVHGHNKRARDQEGLKISLESTPNLNDPRVLLHAQLSF